jgi:gentisate 1,2-dioxygenase
MGSFQEIISDRRRMTFYEEWVEREGLELIKGFFVADLARVPVRPWKRVGGRAAVIDLDGTGDLVGAYVCEIESGKELKPKRHVYEELVFVVSGRGATSVWYEGRPKQTFEWEPGSLFSIPLNAWHQHFNADGRAPARYLAITTAPMVMSHYRQEAFVFENPCVFPERYEEATDYFSRTRRVKAGFTGYRARNVLETNLVANVHEVQLEPSLRGRGTGGIQIDQAGSVLGAHISQVPGGTYTKIHRHGPGAHVLWIEGEGYTLTWPDGAPQRQKVDWNPGTMLVPPTWWWHQHCVVSKTPAKHLALKLNATRRPMTHLHDESMTSTREGGNQIEYEDFGAELTAEVNEIFMRECAQRGTPVRMDQPLDF